MKNRTVRQFLSATEDAMSYVEAHGFLTAIAQTPTIVMPGQWQSLLMGPTTVASETQQDEEAGDLVMQLHEEILVALNAGKDLELPCGNRSDHKAWAKGYLLATRLDKVWRDDALGVELLLPFGVLAGEIDVPASLPDMMERVISELPAHLLLIHEHWIRWRRVNIPPHPNASPMAGQSPVGPHEPCPCNSGLKHERCCGRMPQ
jgi:yecA family protein